MLIHHHAIAGAILAAILYPFFGLPAAVLLFLASFLVDVDNYFVKEII